MPPTAEATSLTSANDVIANPFSFSGFSDELFGEIDLDDIDVGKTTGTDNIDDDAFFDNFAIDSDGDVIVGGNVSLLVEGGSTRKNITVV